MLNTFSVLLKVRTDILWCGYALWNNSNLKTSFRNLKALFMLNN